MSLNPEFTRNLWLQLSLQRLIAAPIVIGIGFALLLLGEMPRADMAEAAGWFFYLLVGFWGTRRAADALAEEVAGNTWDAQRMSALGAWPMSWGKLLGGTVFVWYCAALCLAVYVYAAWPGATATRILVDLAVFVGTGLLGQTVALASCLAILGRGAQGRRLPVTLSQLIGLAVILQVPFGDYVDPVVGGVPVDASWYGMPVQTALFGLLSLAAFLAWALVGVYRLMRVELQYRSYPVVWLAFVAFLALYAEGFLYRALSAPDVPVSAWLALPAAIAAALTYLALFIQPKDIVRYRWLAAAIAERRWAGALTLTPLWLPGFAVTVLLAAAFVVLDPGTPARLQTALRTMPELSQLLSLDRLAAGRLPAVLACLLFMTRDIAFVLFLNFNPRRRRADVAALIYLIVLYAALPGLATMLGAQVLLPIFFPAPWAHPLLVVLPPAVEAAIMIALLAWRMAAARPMPMAAAAR